MNELLLESTGAIAGWLERMLPRLGANWWKEHVVDRLTFQQQRLVQERRLDALSKLDFAAAVRVLDQNWSELAAIQPLPREGRNWVKELQTVRNRWAHAPAEGIASVDAFRDADTLNRLLTLLGASDALLNRVRTFQNSHLGAVAADSTGRDATSSSNTGQGNSSSPTPLSTGKFAVGQLVCLRSNPSAVFPVIEVLRGTGGETRYRVFEGGSRQLYYESQLREQEENHAHAKELSAADLSALLTAIQLTSPSASALYSLNSGRVRFVPYQYRPVFKVIRADRPRLLIADEVGVGKTIEAGLILKELEARSDIKSVLIVCPKALVAERKWELEMKRFDEHFTPLNGSLLRHCIKEAHLSGEWPVQYEKAIVPTSLFDSDLLFGTAVRGRPRDIGLLELDPPPKFDLVIVDEAHHIRNSETLVHQAVRYFADNAEAVLFLSATPVQLGRDDLYTLLNVLRPDLIIDRASFAQMAEPNSFINAAVQACRRGESGWEKEVREQLRSVAATSWGREVLATNPGFQHIYDALAVPGDASIARMKAISALEELYTFSTLINRTRRRDIGEFTTRKAETIHCEFTADQQALHDHLLSVIARILRRLHANMNVKFMMTTISRQAASSLYGLAPALEDMLQGKLAKLESVDEDDGDELNSGFVEEIRADIEALLQRSKKLASRDPKAEAFLRVVRAKTEMTRNKVLVFSTFRHTLRYLVRKLEEEGVRYGLVHGDIPDEERASLRRRFALPKSSPDGLEVLLSSEVGCEGLDFQFCDCLINYDIPWNPMRVEQRIGRIDRYGQESEAVGIFNLITPGTIDAEIYERCLWRIGVFQHAIGGTEEILGEITREIRDVAESFTLSEEGKRHQLQQLADNKIRQIEEERRLEDRQGELFGLNLASAAWERRLSDNRNFWLEPSSLSTAVATYLTRRLGREQEYLLGEKELKTLRLGHDARAAVLEDFRQLPRSVDPVSRAWERWLRGTSPTLQVTFDQKCAVENLDAVLLSLGHPLLRQAAAHLQEREPVLVRLACTHLSLPAKDHPFAMYRWSKQGVRRDEEVVPVTPDEELRGCLMQLLQGAEHAPTVALPKQEAWDALDALHHQQWLAASTEHAEENRQLVAGRVQSLTASFHARKRILEDQIARATNDKILLMKQSELERAQSDFNTRLAVLQRAAESGDIRATPILCGVLHVRRAR